MEKNKKNIAAYISEYAAFIALVLLVIVLGCISPEFRTASNFLNLLRQAAFNGLIAFGMTCVILSDGIDLSVGSTFALSAIVCAQMIVSGMPAFVAIVASLIVGIALGIVSGLLVTKGRLQPFIATLITMTAYRGLAMIITDGKPISRLAASIESESGAFLFKVLGKGNLVGVNTAKTKIIVYAISGFMAALAGLMMISRVDSAQPTLGDGYELDAIAAVALGGTSMSGGRGKICGTFAGVLIIAVLNNGLNILGVSTYYQEVIKAIVILIAVLSDRKR